MIKIFKRVGRIGRLIVERMICRVSEVFIILYSVYNDEYFESIGVRVLFNFVNDKVYFLCYSIEGRYIYKL